MNYRKDVPMLIIVAVIIAAVVIGEVRVFSGSDHFSADARYDGALTYELESGPAETYSVMAFDDGGFVPNSSVSIYMDPGYASYYVNPDIATGARELDEEYYVEQLVKALKFRSVEASIIDAEAMSALMAGGIGGNTDAVIVLSGSLPSTVYGEDEDLIIRWIEAGGRLYWAGNSLGAYSSDGETVSTIENGCSRFLGSECLNGSDENGYAFSMADMCQELCLQNNRMRYAVAPGLLPDGAVHREIGYTDGTYSSVCMAGLGDGMVCVLGGEFSNNQRSDLAQIVASGISHLSTLLDIKNGTVHGTLRGSMSVDGADFVYIHFGGFYPVYGVRTDLRIAASEAIVHPS